MLFVAQDFSNFEIVYALHFPICTLGPVYVLCAAEDQLPVFGRHAVSWARTVSR